MNKCELCGEPMPVGEKMFKYHGYSGPCPKPPLSKAPDEMDIISFATEALRRSKEPGTRLALRSLITEYQILKEKEKP